MSNIQLHDLVAIKEDIRTQRFLSDDEILLPQGLIGTVVLEFEQGEAFEVEFADDDGQTYAMLPIEAEKLFLVFFSWPEMPVANLAAAS